MSTRCVIKYGTTLGYVNRVNSGMCMAQFSELEHAKIFKDRVEAQIFIDTYGAGGYGLAPDQCKIVLLSEVKS